MEVGETIALSTRFGLALAAVLTAMPSARALGTDRIGQIAPANVSGADRASPDDCERRDIGVSDALGVPPPWTAVRLNGRSAQVSGRRVVLGSGPLPEQIVSRGRDLFAEPPTLKMSVDGEHLDLSSMRVVTDETDAGDVRSKAVENFDALRVTSELTIEYDGLITIDLEIVPKRSFVLDRLSVELPLHTYAAGSFRRFLSYDYARQRLDQSTLLETAGEVRSHDFAFNPAVWFGGEGIGIEWIMESDRNVRVEAVDRVHRVRRGGDVTRFTTTFVDAPVELDRSISYRFALMPTPVRPDSNPLKGRHLVPISSIGGGDPASEKALFIGNARNRSPKRTGALAPWVADPAHYAEIADGAGVSQSRVLPYAALYLLSGAEPCLPIVTRDWFRRKAPGNWRSAGVAGSDVVYVPDFETVEAQDFHIDAHVKIIEAGFGGIYLDAAFPNAMAGQTIESDIDGGSHLRYPFFAHRRFAGRYRAAIKRSDPDALIVSHASTIPMFAAAYSDVIVDGEALARFFRRRPARGATDGARSPLSYWPDYLRFDPAFVSARFPQQDGFAHVLLPMVLKGNADELERNPELFERWTRSLIATALLADLPFWRTRLHGPTVRGFDESVAAFGGLGGDASRLTAVQAEALVGGTSEEVRAVAYERGDEILLMVANFSFQSRKVEIDAGRLVGRESPARSRIEVVGQTARASAESPSTAGSSLMIPPRDYVLLTLSFE